MNDIKNIKIASNTPGSFSPKIGYDFIQLGEDITSVSMIIVMLEKSWGGGFIQDIKDLTSLIASYPDNIPCHIIGCETRIPDLDVKKYAMIPRDEAIRSLCDEVLKRSATIGIRSKLTYLHLTELLGYNGNQIDLIYENNDPGPREGLLNFLSKNKLPSDIFLDDIFKFQVSPKVLGKNIYSENISIGHPYVTNHGATVRLNADVEIDGQVTTLWLETDACNENFLLWERSDAFLCIILPFAIRNGKNIKCASPVTEHFLHNLTEVLIPHLCIHDNRLYHTRIIANYDDKVIGTGDGVATGMSCGVDSLYSAAQYVDSPYKSMNLTHLYIGNYLYGNDGVIYERGKNVAVELNLKLVQTGTNINLALDLPHVPTHFFKTMFGVLSLRKLFRVYYYSSAFDFGNFNLKNNSEIDTAQYELLLLYTFSCPDFQVLTGGGKSSRLEKTRGISDFNAAHRFLNVCLEPNLSMNCGKCGKCLRTLLMLDMLNVLDKFRDVFDIDVYNSSRLDAMVYLVKEKNSPILSEVYEYFLRTDPGLINLAKEKI